MSKIPPDRIKLSIEGREIHESAPDKYNLEARAQMNIALNHLHYALASATTIAPETADFDYTDMSDAEIADLVHLAKWFVASAQIYQQDSK